MGKSLVLVALVACASVLGMLAMPREATVMLPNGWILDPPRGAVAQTGTMPQGMAISPDGSTIAVVESGFNPPALSLYRVPDLARINTIALPGAFGRPVWTDSGHVLVAGANADALLRVDVKTAGVHRIALPKGSYPVFVAASSDGRNVAVATAGDSAVRIGSLASISHAKAIPIGGFPGTVAFSSDNATVFATVRLTSNVLAIDATRLRVKARQNAGLHPAALLVSGDKVYVAEADVDTIGVYDAHNLRLLDRISVADRAPANAIGVSPGSLSESDGTIYVALAGANSVALIRDDRVTGRMEAGWYPTDAAALHGRLYVLDGKGEGSRPNTKLRPGSFVDYIGAIEFGSLRAYDMRGVSMAGSPQGSVSWAQADPGTVIRPDGPIKHVFFILKENRSYDQVLGDVTAGNGDPALAWFGQKVTPNEHAIAERFGLFDNAYVSGEVSAVGHMWTDAAFANDYVQRYWPSLYGQRFVLDDLSHGDGTRVPAAGYIWDSARRAHVAFRDYGELIIPGKAQNDPWVTDVASLQGRFDPRFEGWNPEYSDLSRVNEWRREFTAFVRAGTLPQFEFIWLPGDHTLASKPGELTPASYVAINDAALGQVVDTISHSKVWSSSAVFAIEDDAQDGPDHVSDQRTTLFVASPYARGGLRHEHYATVSVLRTIEIVLGMKPLSTYDAMATPMYAAFTLTPDMRPYNAIAPRIDVTKRNTKMAFGAAESERLDFSRPDAVEPAVLDAIIAKNH